MSRRRKVVLAVVAAVVAAIAAFVIPTVWLRPWSIDHFYLRVFAQYALRRPMFLSSLRILEPLGLQFHNDDLDDFSVAFRQREARWVERQLRILQSYNRDAMSEAGRLSYDILAWFLADSLDGDRFAFHYYPVNQMSGVQITLPDFMITTHRVDSLRGARQYVSRVSKFGKAFDQVLESVELQKQKGIVPPRFIIRYVLEGMTRFIAMEPSKNVLFTHLESKLRELSNLQPRDRQEVLAAAEREIGRTVYPAYRRLIAFLADLQGIATDDDGAWKLPDGAAFYAWTLRHHTTTGMSGDEIHALGLSELARRQAEMRAILRAQGYPADDLMAAMHRLNGEKRFQYPNTSEGREQALRDYQKIIDEIDEGSRRFLDVRPPVGVKVKRVPEFKEAKAPGGYYVGPPMDRSEPGTFYVNLRDMREIPRFGMRTLVYHETIPGHHVQGTIAQSLADVPFFRRVIGFTAYSEGWALYAERLAAEQGYEEDPFDRLGYLSSEAFRAVRLVVDTGIHEKRWTREQAIDFMLVNTGMPKGEVVAEVERYIVDPGQACGYMVGALKIVELRQRLRERQGGSFDLGKFHDLVLTSGAMPLDILEKLILE